MTNQVSMNKQLNSTPAPASITEKCDFTKRGKSNAQVKVRNCVFLGVEGWGVGLK